MHGKNVVPFWHKFFLTTLQPESESCTQFDGYSFLPWDYEHVLASEFISKRCGHESSYIRSTWLATGKLQGPTNHLQTTRLQKGKQVQARGYVMHSIVQCKFDLNPVHLDSKGSW